MHAFPFALSPLLRPLPTSAFSYLSLSFYFNFYFYFHLTYPSQPRTRFRSYSDQYLIYSNGPSSLKLSNAQDYQILRDPAW
ncbi:hypothetical protein LZ32DRAFT_610262 [Colletotrichum eremochloae]|nr:hypothetical protein LZ32DRAFT_610262 [Colletotrichum eremochloae]